MGLMSPGGVHSHQNHAVALAKILASAGIPTVFHAFMDGRDTPPRAGADYMAKLVADLPASTRVVTVTGRYYAMDRDNRWERVSKAYEAVVAGKGVAFAAPAAAIADAYAKDVTDEFILPAVIGDYKGMRDGDGVLCFNFRADRVRELLAAILDPKFSGFQRGRIVKVARRPSAWRNTARRSMPSCSAALPASDR